MKFTTHFALYSQTTRLSERVPYAVKHRVTDGIITLYDPFFQKSYARVTRWPHVIDYNSQHTTRVGDLKFELFPLHSPLLGESLLVSFPPLNNMLKFSG
jgi:hypothetical protein